MLSDFLHTKSDSNPKGNNQLRKVLILLIDKAKVKYSKVDPKIAKKLSDEEPTIQKRDKPTQEDKNFTEISSEKHPALGSQIKHKIKEFIGHLDHVPEFLKDNEFIHTGYRINFSTPKKVLKR